MSSNMYLDRNQLKQQELTTRATYIMYGVQK